MPRPRQRVGEFLFLAAADLADQHDALGAFVGEEQCRAGRGSARPSPDRRRRRPRCSGRAPRRRAGSRFRRTACRSSTSCRAGPGAAIRRAGSRASSRPGSQGPGVEAPTQVAPASRTMRPIRSASCTGMPSATVTISLMPAAIASSTAASTPCGGTMASETCAPVAATAARAVGEHRHAFDAVRAGAGRHAGRRCWCRNPSCGGRARCRCGRWRPAR